MAKTMTELMALFPNNPVILDAAIKTEDHIARQAAQGGKILVSVSGGSDSDIMLDLFQRIGYPDGLVHYAWIDTGMEYAATKRHLTYLENRYGITIHRYRPKLTVAQACKRYGVPFLSKRDSQRIAAMQRHEFSWGAVCENGYRADEYWWNGNGRTSARHAAGLREYMMENPPDFRISDRCCYYAKKQTSNAVEQMTAATMVCLGMRKSEGGIRSVVLKSCFTEAKGTKAARFYPIFWFSDEDKAEYEVHCGIRHSDCYTVWGFSRTGCACCPFGSRFEDELAVVQKHEPKLYAVANKVFGASYEYTRKYRAFKESLKRERRRGGQIDLFDDPYNRMGDAE